VQSFGSQLCIDIPGGDTSSGALLWTWDCTGSYNQLWSAMSYDNRWVSPLDSKKCMDLLGGDTTNGNLIGLWDCNGGASQKWVFDLGKSTIKFKGDGSNSKCVALGGWNRGDRLMIWDCITDESGKPIPSQWWHMNIYPSNVDNLTLV